MSQIITFNKKGYDSFIDFIKAYAIICVLIGHTLPHHDYWGYGLWAGMQVPLFILVQAFHCFKKESYSFSLKKVLWRVIIPFVAIQVIIFVNYILKTEIPNYNHKHG
jgi:fucose 4-O-acetylase-like acetyltransferase